MNMRDPIIYRIMYAHHHRTGDKWCVYPMYDFAHPLSDACEKVTHSLCSLEFENHRPLYDWVVNECIDGEKPRQIEFARLNLNYTLTSKRKCLKLVHDNIVSGWDDPRMATISGMRRRGYPAEESVISASESAFQKHTVLLIFLSSKRVYVTTSVQNQGVQWQLLTRLNLLLTTTLMIKRKILNAIITLTTLNTVHAQCRFLRNCGLKRTTL